MTVREQREKAQELILAMTAPFNVADANLMADRNGIKRNHFLDVLDDLVDAGVLSYREIQDGAFAFEVKR